MTRKTISTVTLIVVIVAFGIGAYIVAHNSNSSNSPGRTDSTSSAGTRSNNATPQQNTKQMVDSVLKIETDASLGNYLATPNGKALYTYGADGTDVSNCTGDCLAEWPAYENTSGKTDLPKNVGSIKRADNNQIQFTYKGSPLYTFVDDSSGQVTGNNKYNFHVAKP